MENIYKRQYREQRPETKEKISNSLLTYHANKGTEQKRETASKISRALLNYWQHVPSRSEYERQNQGLSMQEYLCGHTF